MVIGVDLGGTNIRAGILDGENLTRKVHTQLRDKDSLDSTLHQFIETIRPLVSPEIQGIGVAVPSIVDSETGVVFNVVNIPSWERVELKKILEEEFHIPVQVENDANCFALGEQMLGEARGLKNVVAATLGTGVGSGVIVNGKLYPGTNGGAGEIGYLPFRDRDFEFYCASAWFKEVHGTSAQAVYEAATKGDSAALNIWSEFGVNVGSLIKAIAYAYDPQAIVFGGSIAHAFVFFESAMKKTMHENFWFPGSMNALKIFQSKHPDIILLGAASLLA